MNIVMRFKDQEHEHVKRQLEYDSSGTGSRPTESLLTPKQSEEHFNPNMIHYLDDLGHGPLADLDPAGELLVQLLLVPRGQGGQEAGQHEYSGQGSQETGQHD